ncbi:MAG TPA: HlyD family secretion protein [Candidatus Acidoferrales bacterium]|nr:HlyD family secretion protein [Candidatus Acidoferrales bacterium]
MADKNPVPTETIEAPRKAPAPAAPPVPRSYSQPKRRKFLLVGAGILILAIAGVLLWLHFSSYESTDDAQADVHLYPVSARISGYVVRVNAGDNQWVEKGTVLVEIDPKDYEVAAAQARANLASAEATAQSLNITVPITSVDTSSQLTSTSSDVESAKAGIAASDQQLAAAHAQLEQAQANDVKAQDDLARYKLLVEKKEVAEQVYDQALAVAKSSTAAIAAARANESAAQQATQQARSKLAQAEASRQYAETGPQQVSSSRARARAAIADVEQRRAALDQAELNLSYTKIVAPVSGSVNKNIVEGTNVQTGQQLLTIVPLDEVWVTANFKETQLKKMRVGQKVKIHVDSTGHTLNGHVDSFAGATGPVFSLLPPENATGNYVKIVQRVPVKIVLEPGENKSRELRPGMNVVPDVYLR